MKSSPTPALIASLLLALCGLATAMAAGAAHANEGRHAVERHYVTAPPAPSSQTAEQVHGKSAGCMSCHTSTDNADHALEPGGEARLHRLSRRRCHGVQRSAEGHKGLPDRPGARPRAAKISGRLALSVVCQPRTHLHAAERRGAGVHPLRQSLRLPGGSGILRRLPHGHHRGLGAQHALHRSHAVGWRVIQQRHPAVQELHPRRVLYAGRRGCRAERARASRKVCRTRPKPPVSCRPFTRCRRGRR